MRFYQIIGILFICFFSSAHIYGAENLAQTEKREKIKWLPWRTTVDRTIYYADDKKTGLVQIKANLIVQSSLSGFLLFLQDVEHIPNWLDNAEQALIVEQLSPTDNIFMTKFNALWPVKSRDMVIRTRYWQNEDLSLEIHVQNMGNVIPKNPEYIRMEMLFAQWVITPLTKERINIEYQIQVDPRGSLPLWLVNSMALRGMWQTLKNIQQQLPNSKWQQEKLPNITELEH